VHGSKVNALFFGELRVAGTSAEWSSSQVANYGREDESGLRFEVHAGGGGEGGVAEGSEECYGAADSEREIEGVGAVEEPAGEDGRGGGDEEALRGTRRSGGG